MTLHILSLLKELSVSKKNRKAFLIFTIVLAATIFGSVVFSGARKVQRPPRTIPPISSKINTIEVVSSRVVNEDTPAVGVEIVVRNWSAKPVMAIDLVAGDGAVTKNGLTDEENPIVVIEPYGTTTLAMTFGAMTPGASLIISAVTYGDGTEEGDEESLRIMRKVREREKERIQAARRGERPQ
jgi:hypothetical protein